VVVSEAVAEAGGATITSTMTKVKRQIAIAVEEDMDVVVEAEESNAITVRHLDIMHQTAEASQLDKSDSQTLQKH
jgi:hypothetical protein